MKKMTSHELIYELPKEKDKLIEIIDSIPSNWSWIDGFLSAPKELYKKDKIAKNTRLYISRWYSINPTILGADDVPFEKEYGLRKKEEFVIPNLFEVLCERKLFSSVSFNEAGFETSQKFIKYFIGLEYRGWISADRGYRDNNKYHNPERFSFSHLPKRVFGEELPLHISLEWDKEYGGKKENLLQIIKKILSLNLKEIKK